MTPLRLPALATVVALLTLSACGGDGTPAVAPPPPDTFPITGTAVPGMASVDRVIQNVMTAWDIPGGAIAVVKDGRLVYARGFGYADAEAKRAAEPTSLFRVASVSKPITAAAVLKLVEEGKLDLDAKAYAMRPDLTPAPGATVDARIYDVTVRQLLWHAGGWDRDRSFDPMFRSTEAATAVGATAPASAETVMRYMLGQPLDFAPGSRYAYSNFGYAVLGRVVEAASGQAYDEYVRRAVLAPAGITRMRLGRSLYADRASDEVRYYDPNNGPSVFAGGGTVSFPYGGFHLEAMDAHGGWVASAVDLMRFVTAVDGVATRPDVLAAASVEAMTARPQAPLWQGTDFYYAMGWLVRPAEGNWWHDGSLPGTAALVVRTGSGLAWAALFNAREMTVGSRFQAQIDGAMWEAVRGVTEWPAHDLFSQHP